MLAEIFRSSPENNGPDLIRSNPTGQENENSKEVQRRSFYLIVFFSAILPALLAYILVAPTLQAQTNDKPPAPRLTINHEQRSVDIGWDAVQDASRYQLWVWTESDSWQQLDDELTDTSFTHADLKVGTTYWYAYRAVLSSGDTSAWSEYGSATISDSLAAPVLTAALDGNAVSLSWIAVSGAVRYQLWAWDDVNLWQLLDDDLQATTFRHSSIVPGTTYYYSARAQNSAGNSSAWSDYASIQVPQNVVPEDTPTPTITPTPTVTATPDPNATATPTATPTPTTDPNANRDGHGNTDGDADTDRWTRALLARRVSPSHRKTAARPTVQTITPTRKASSRISSTQWAAASTGRIPAPISTAPERPISSISWPAVKPTTAACARQAPAPRARSPAIS